MLEFYKSLPLIRFDQLHKFDRDPLLISYDFNPMIFKTLKVLWAVGTSLVLHDSVVSSTDVLIQQREIHHVLIKFRIFASFQLICMRLEPSEDTCRHVVGLSLILLNSAFFGGRSVLRSVL